MVHDFDGSDTRFFKLIDNPVLVLELFFSRLKIGYLLHLFFQLSHVLLFICFLRLSHGDFVIERGGVPPASGQRNHQQPDAQEDLGTDIVLGLGRTALGTCRQKVYANHRSPTDLSANPTPTDAIGANSASVAWSKSLPDVSTSAKGLATSTTACMRSRSCFTRPPTCAPPPHSNTCCTSPSDTVDLK